MPSLTGYERMVNLLSWLGNPEQNFKAIHIAGTNGKGSTGVMIASILEAAGYTVGLYTSPHLEEECERVQIWNGDHRMIPQEHFEELMDRVRKIRSKYDPECSSLFDIYTAAAYLYFDEVKPDYVILECGLGGRLDMTNTLSRPLVSVITQIGMDHTAELGNTIIKIAREKAGIIKPGVPVVSQTPELLIKNVIHRIADEKGSKFIDASLVTGNYSGYRLAMRGEHQLRNAATAVEAIRAAGIEVSEEDIRTGLARAVNPGRFEILREKPYWIIDGAHNPDAIQALTETFSKFAADNKIRRTLVIFGCMKDKNYRHMIQLLTGNMRGCSYATVAVDYDRAEDPEVLGEVFAANGRGCTCYESVSEAFCEAKASNYECILITGSIYVAGAMRSYFFEYN
ncbi:MAG: bifunctional folylpolyglutamate synthase/dihydrofolate synthase [Mogibacterium sp.]|nr:bifunctional folylpolyglutamate synthase/dihydrofolate synthase [Mogibacterium sp.]